MRTLRSFAVHSNVSISVGVKCFSVRKSRPINDAESGTESLVDLLTGTESLVDLLTGALQRRHGGTYVMYRSMSSVQNSMILRDIISNLLFSLMRSSHSLNYAEICPPIIWTVKTQCIETSLVGQLVGKKWSSKPIYRYMS